MKALNLRTLCSAFVLMFTLSAAVFAQAPQFSPAMQEANTLWQAQKWPEARKAYEAVLKGEPENAVAWARYGLVLHALADYQKAIEAFQKSIGLPPQPAPPGLYYRVARAYSKLNEKEKAFEWMTKAVQNGFSNTQLVVSDPDIAEMRADARWKDLDAKMVATARPCTAKPEFRQFDFWIGEWDLQGRSGQKLGSSKIELILDTCVIHETYSGPNNYVGRAFHFYNAATGKWDQHYIDTAGVPFDWTGEFKDGKLIYTNQVVQNGKDTMQRMTFTKLAADRVHQLFEQSTDGGKTWQTGFDGTYVKKSPTN